MGALIIACACLPCSAQDISTAAWITPDGIETESGAGDESGQASGTYLGEAIFTSLPVEVKAKSAILMEASTRRVLLAENEHERRFPASVTKIMTMLLVTEAIDDGRISLTDTVTASSNAVSKGGSQIWLEEGEQMTVDELLKATAVGSANDAATALGEYVAGSEEGFIAMMNDRARELGMNDTNFDNCTGLDDTTDTHLTSAYDIALMSAELIKHERITNYTTIWMDSLRSGQTELTNTNRLVRFYSGTTGLKTGTTAKAGNCLSATAKRDGLHLVAVVLGSENSTDRFEGAKALLNWGFSNYAIVGVSADTSLIKPVNILHGVENSIEPVIPEIAPVLVSRGSEKEIAQTVELAADIAAPVEQGQVLGKICVTLSGQTVAEYPLVAPYAVEKLGFPGAFMRILRMLAGLAA
ncbi:MAG: D-alanyl-D-alanine carboxypeptidase [Clostridiales bacterium]|nr:D-alanyl-D-alanine carboxypeptidase [Clostridiales bacterium]